MEVTLIAMAMGWGASRFGSLIATPSTFRRTHPMPQIYCIEGDWGFDPGSSASVRLFLELIASIDEHGGMVHRTAVTRGEFTHHLERWLKLSASDYPLLYLGTHGTEATISLGVDDISLDELADLLGDRAAGRIIHFGSCSVLNLPENDLKTFCSSTGVAAITGYSESVDWLPSAACDMLLLPAILGLAETDTAGDGRSLRPLMVRFAADHPGFVETLGLTVATKSWTSRGE